MRLLQTEIDVVPGREPDRAARAEGLVGIGSAYLEIKNSTDRVNSYTIRVVCDHPYWQAAWYQLLAMPAEAGDQNKAPAGKPDQPGAKNQSLKIHINKDGVRKVLIAFKVPENAEARAGTYAIRIVIESVITDATVASGPPRITELPATVIVRPFYDWDISFRPEDKSVGTLRRRAHVELFVTNKGNDWLYLEFKKTPTQAMNLEAPVVRLAVAPPEPGQTLERSVPLTAVTKLRTIRGDKNSTNLPVTVTRVDAPTVPPLPEAVKECHSANLGRAVLATSTNQVQAAETPGTLTYCPPIPATLAGFFQALLRNAKALAMLAVGAFLMFMGLTYLYEKTMHSISNVYLEGVQGDDLKSWEGDVPLVLEGDLLKPCVIEGTFTDNAHPDNPVKFEIDPKDEEYKSTNERPWYTAITWGVKPPHYRITLDADLRDQIGKGNGTVKLTVARKFLFLGSLGMKPIPPKDVPAGFLIGALPVSVAKIDATAAAPVLNPGDNVILNGAFGKNPAGAKVKVDGLDSRFVTWSDGSVTIAVPPHVSHPDGFNVVITRNDTPIWSGQFSIKAPAAATAGATAATTSGAPPASTGGSAPAAAGGDQGGSSGSKGATVSSAPPPPGAAQLVKAMGSGPPPAGVVKGLPAATPTDHAVRAVGFYLAGDETDGSAEAKLAPNDFSPPMNALTDAIYIEQELRKPQPSTSQIEKLSADIAAQLGPSSPLKLPYLVAGHALQQVNKPDDAKKFLQLGGGS